MSDVKSPSVALLIKDIKVAKEVSNIFRAMDVLPYIYNDLKSFWFGTIEELPSFCLVDVQLFTEGDLSLAQHPQIKAQAMPVALYYSNATAPLAYTSFEVLNFGLISADLPLSGQIKAVLKRVNKLNQLESELRESEVKASGLQHQIDRVVRGTEKLKESDHYLQLLKRSLQTFDALRDQEDFYQAVQQGFQQLGFVESFSLYELSFNAQKLISPQIVSHKFKELPSLWLGQTGYQGIEFYAQNMASQVAIDMMGANLMSLLLKGKRSKPEVILFVKTEDEEVLNNLDWSVLEYYLTGLYSHFELKKGNVQNSDKRQLTNWEFYSFLDSCFLGKVAGDTAEIQAGDSPFSLVNINFADLNDAIESAPLIRFYWTKFIEDFIGRFEASKHHKFKFSHFGTENLVFIVDRDNVDTFFNDLKSFALRFPIWRYFEEPEVILAKNLKPDIQMVPLSTQAYRSFIKQKSVSIPAETVSVPNKGTSIRPRMNSMTN